MKPFSLSLTDKSKEQNLDGTCSSVSFYSDTTRWHHANGTGHASGSLSNLLLLCRSSRHQNPSLTTPALLLRFLLQRVLFTLSFTTSNTLGGQPLIAKCRPRTKVLTALAPFDLESRLCYYPHVDVAYRAQALVLGGYVGVVAIGAVAVAAK